MQTKIIGSTLPVLEIQLDAGEQVVGTPDQLSWMMGDVHLTTTTACGGATGVWGLVSRAVSGGGMFMTEFRAGQGPGMVAFAAKLPGSITEIKLQNDQGYLVHRHGLICATPGISIATAAQSSLGSGLFGGEGFILQHLTGEASAWIELGGEVVSYDLGARDTCLVHPGHVGMFEDRVSFEITTMPGVKNALFGGDGLFLAKLTGPGRIWLQTLTPAGVAHAVSPYLPAKHG